MSNLVIGIDLGTTNSVAAVADGESVQVLADEAGNRLIPSVVSFHPEGRILVGEEARERRLIDARNTVYSIKRLIGRPFKSPEVERARDRFAFELAESGSGGVVVSIRDETYTLTEISAFVLREVRRIAEARIGTAVNKAVITVPANFNELQRSATKAAGRVAGLEVARIINEPTAAALAYGYGKDRAERVAVFDLGGGTFDLTILELDADVFEVVATEGDSFLGGDDIDLILTEAMAQQFLRQHRYDLAQDPQAMERLRAAAEWAKCQLSSDTEVELTVEELVYSDSGHPLDLSFRMSRPELELRARPTVQKAIDACERALQRAKLTPAEIDSIILVGGSTRVPLVREMVEEFFGQTPRSEIDPDLVVAQGAALHAMALSGPVASPGRKALGKVSLRKVSRGDRDKVQAAREARAEALPKQPAFAPTSQVDRMPAGLGFDDPTAAKAKRPASGSTPLATPSSTTDLTEDSGLLMLDDPSVPDVRAVILGASTAPANPKRAKDHTAPFGTGSGPIPTPNVAKTLGKRNAKATILGGMAPPPVAPPPVAKKPRPIAPPPVAAPPVAAPSSTMDLDPSQIEIESEPPPAISPTVSSTHSLGLDDLEMLIEDEPTMIASDPIDLGAPLPMGDPPSMASMPTMAAIDAEVARPVLKVSGDAPLLMDVTPLALGLEMAGGYCQHVIRRNAPIPTEQSRVFSTGQDDQTEVELRICQGDSRVYDENQALGTVLLTDLREAPRGDVSIEVTFIIDASGTLDVRAVDTSTGAQQATRIDLLGGVSDDEIAAMQARQAAALGDDAG